MSVPIVQIGASSGWDRAVEQIKDWRENHRHEIDSSGNGDTSMIVESSSSHERAIPLGFAPEPEGVGMSDTWKLIERETGEVIKEFDVSDIVGRSRERFFNGLVFKVDFERYTLDRGEA